MFQLPSSSELYSGKPVEWSPYDVDARLLRWATLHFSFVPKGQDARPELPEDRAVQPDAVDREKLRRLVEAAPDLDVRYACPEYELPGEKFVFDLSCLRGATSDRAGRPHYAQRLAVKGLTHRLDIRFVESRTGRADLLVSFARAAMTDKTRIAEQIDMTSLAVGLMSLNAEHPHKLSRSVIGLPQLRVIQNIPVGGCYKLSVDVAPTMKFSVPGDIVFFEPDVY